MNKKLVELIEKYFFEQLYSKTGWGRNEIMAAFKDSVTKAVLEIIDKK